MTQDIFKKRQSRTRHRLATHGARPRLSIFRSGKHIYAQVIDDAQAVTVAAASTNEKDGKEAKSWNVNAATSVGKKIAERTLAKKQRNFARSDQIRNELAEQGVILEDSKDGVRWKRK